MFEELWSEIQDAPGEIFDLPELRELDEEKFNLNDYLNSNIDYWWKLSKLLKCPVIKVSAKKTDDINILKDFLLKNKDIKTLLRLQLLNE